MHCLLCSGPANAGESESFDCSHCGLKFKDPKKHISRAEEVVRYNLHKNDSTDERYRTFLCKLVTPLNKFLPKTSYTHLDFGCGPAPTVSVLLESTSAQSYNYDPQFFNQFDLLKTNFYDVLTSTEVVEHFREPASDWKLIVSLVKPQGLIAIMTQILKEETDFSQWWYKNDPTHIVFYRKKTMDYLCKIFNLELLYYDEESVIIFRKQGE